MQPVATTTFEKFFDKLAHGGYLLFLAAIAAVVWAKISPEGYQHFWHTMLTIGVGEFSLSLSLVHWVNDILMTFFFFTVGLEIKREFLVGALSDKKKAVLPICAAAGEMILSALIYFALNTELPESKGWGIHMATDIAFSLAVLSILGPRSPFGVRNFLTAFAIADDLGAVLVIAIFYTPDIQFVYLTACLTILVALGILNRCWVRSAFPYLFLGAMLWVGVSFAGLHATVAWVIFAMYIPARGKYDMTVFLDMLEENALTIRKSNSSSVDIMLNRAHLNAVQAIDLACSEVKTPLQRLELTHAKRVSLIVLQLFALANTGLVLKGLDVTEALLHPVDLGVGAGLVLGKSLGIFGGTYLASQILRIPLFDGFTWSRVLGVGFLGGIGFTMSLFISSLSFVRPELLDLVKIGIISGSIISSVCGYFVLRLDTVKQNGR